MRNFVGVMAIAGLLLTAGAAQADVILDTVTMQYTGVAPGGVCTIWGGEWPGGQAVLAGFYNFSKTASTGAGDLISNPINSFCIELPQEPGAGGVVYNVVLLREAPLPALYGTPMQAAKEDLLRELWGRHYSDTIGSNANALIFQECVWEIVYENTGSLNVTAGDFRANGSTATANAWLGELNGSGPKATLRALTNPYQQDYVVFFPGGEVPEPATMAFLGLGAAAMFYRRRRAV